MLPNRAGCRSDLHGAAAAGPLHCRRLVHKRRPHAMHMGLPTAKTTDKMLPMTMLRQRDNRSCTLASGTGPSEGREQMNAWVPCLHPQVNRAGAQTVMASNGSAPCFRAAPEQQRLDCRSGSPTTSDRPQYHPEASQHPLAPAETPNFENVLLKCKYGQGWLSGFRAFGQRPTRRR